MGEILEGKYLQILSKFVETNIKKFEISCIYENKSLKTLVFWPFAKIKPVIFLLKLKNLLLQFWGGFTRLFSSRKAMYCLNFL